MQRNTVNINDAIKTCNYTRWEPFKHSQKFLPSSRRLNLIASLKFQPDNNSIKQTVKKNWYGD